MVSHGAKTILNPVRSPLAHISSRRIGARKKTVDRLTILTLILAFCLLALPPGPALAASRSTLTPQVRTYVSGLGSDSNACTAAQPCRTLKAALARTTAGGEIYVLDSADYGPVNINKAVTIAADGAVAGVLATTGVGILISAGANDVVTLRGLHVDGGKTGSVGIQFSAGKALNLLKSVLRDFVSAGLSFAPSGASTLFISDTSATNGGNNGILINGSGSAGVGGIFNRVTASGNGVGIFASGGSVNVTISDTVAGNNTLRPGCQWRRRHGAQFHDQP